MTEGKRNRGIATLPGLSLGTVQDHVSHILEKLGLENRHAAAVLALTLLRQRRSPRVGIPVRLQGGLESGA